MLFYVIFQGVTPPKSQLLSPDNDKYDAVKAAEMESEQAILSQLQQQQQDVISEGRSSFEIPGVAYDKVTRPQTVTSPYAAGGDSSDAAAHDDVPLPQFSAAAAAPGSSSAVTASPIAGIGTSGTQVPAPAGQGLWVTTDDAADQGGTYSDSVAAAAAGSPAGGADVEYESPRSRFQAVKAKFERGLASGSSQQQQQQQLTPDQSPRHKLKKGRLCFRLDHFDHLYVCKFVWYYQSHASDIDMLPAIINFLKEARCLCALLVSTVFVFSTHRSCKS